MKLPINRSRLRDWHYIVALKAPHAALAAIAVLAVVMVWGS